ILTGDVGSIQMNCSRNSRGRLLSFSRRTPSSKYPAFDAHFDASAAMVAVHRRSMLGGRIWDNAACVTESFGRQTGPAMADDTNADVTPGDASRIRSHRCAA